MGLAALKWEWIKKDWRTCWCCSVMIGFFDVPVNGCQGASCSIYSSNSRSEGLFKWGFQRRLNKGLTNVIVCRSNGSAFRVSTSPGKDNSIKEIIMVDPLEAKRLAQKQMQEIKGKEKLKRQRQIEAINGAWAMIGLTAGLVIEGHTGKSILTQLAGYLSAVISFFAG